MYLNARTANDGGILSGFKLIHYYASRMFDDGTGAIRQFVERSIY